MTWTVLGFQNKAALQKYLTDNAVLPAKVHAIYFDASSGEHVLVIHA